MVLAKGAGCAVTHIRAAVIKRGVLVYKVISRKIDAIDSAAGACSVRVNRISDYRGAVAGVNAIDGTGYSVSIQIS